MMNSECDLYKVYIENTLVGNDMPLQFALILIKAIYGEFYNEPNLKVTIQKIEQETKVDTNNDN